MGLISLDQILIMLLVIVGMGVAFHGPELEDGKMLAMITGALLTKDQHIG